MAAMLRRAAPRWLIAPYSARICRRMSARELYEALVVTKKIERDRAQEAPAGAA